MHSRRHVKFRCLKQRRHHIPHYRRTHDRPTDGTPRERQSDQQRERQPRAALVRFRLLPFFLTPAAAPVPPPALAKEKRRRRCGCVWTQRDVDCGADDRDVGIGREEYRTSTRVPYRGEGKVEEGIDPAENEGGRVEDEGPVEREAVNVCDLVNALAFINGKGSDEIFVRGGRGRGSAPLGLSR